MSIKRRRFVQSLLLTPAAPAALAAAQATPVTTPQQQPVPQPNTPARQVPRQPQNVPKLPVVQMDLAGKTDQHFFSAEQFATLQKLGSVLMPPIKGNPGALDTDAPEFLDFLLSVSPGDRQQLYQHGLGKLNSMAKTQFQAPFAELSATQIDNILRPLLVVRYWPEDLPKDPLKNFVAQVHEDLRTATVNSREWAAATAKSGHRFTRGFSGQAMYWAPIDPISEG